MVTASRALGSNYELVDPIGAGAMGEVWRALDRAQGTEVAAKVLRSEYAANPEIVTRFLQERSILLGLRHPGIVRVHDLVVEGDSLAIVMDLVEGSDLRGALAERGTLAPQLAVGVVAAVLDALAAAHAQGALHRDVKPDNVLVRENWQSLEKGSVLLSDFSIARLAQESTVQATGLLGTPEYMPPELFEHGTSSAASDVYAAGIVLYELLAGRTPYAGGGNAFTIGNRAVTAEPPPLDLPDALAGLLGTLIDRDPRRRLTAEQAAAALRGLAPALAEVPALPVQPAPTSWQRARADDLATQPIRPVSAPAGLDVGRTNLDVNITSETFRAVEGEQALALVPGTMPEDLQVGATNLVARPQEYQAPTLRPKAEPVAEAKTRPAWLTALVAVVCVGALVGLVFGIRPLLSGGKKHDGGTAAAGPMAAEAADPVNETTGLTITRKAEYDAGAHRVTLTIELAAGRVALTGPFLQVLPSASGNACPSGVAWSGAGTVVDNVALETGVTAPCSYKLAAEVPAGGKVSLEASLPMAFNGGAQDKVQAWLQKTAIATTTALDAVGKDNSSYGAQRLTGIEVDVPAFVSTSDAEIRVKLLPVWKSGVDSQHPMFDSSTGKGSTLLDQVGGGPKGVRLTADNSCSGALIIGQGNHVSVRNQTDQCAIVADVGNLVGEQSPTFAINGLGG